MDALQKTKFLIANGILPAGTEVLGRFEGGTVSELYLLGEGGSARYVIKSNVPEIIKSEASFLHSYRDADILPELLYKDAGNEYMVYQYLSGEVLKTLNDKRSVLASLTVRLINQYKEISPLDGWGWKDETVSSWEQFILIRAKGAAETLSGYLQERDGWLVEKLIQDSPVNTSKKAYLLHGDCGIHNFLIQDGELTGIIDPTPVIGPPLYDLLYAFCSSPDDITAETIQYCSGLMVFENNLTKHELYKEVLIILYIRIATCLKHHPEDFKEYLKAWEYWKAKVL
jgi:aminoglycoside phosphotransferase (APT) family kinase protein